jgi:hypothetical protein
MSHGDKLSASLFKEIFKTNQNFRVFGTSGSSGRFLLDSQGFVGIAYWNWKS